MAEIKVEYTVVDGQTSANQLNNSNNGSNNTDSFKNLDEKKQNINKQSNKEYDGDDRHSCSDSSDARPESAENSENNRNLIINYLPTSFKNDDLREYFSKFGPIESCKLICDKITGQSLGYGFVQFVNANDAITAREKCNEAVILDKKIRVSFARPSSEQIKGANLYVSGLAKDITEELLKEMFNRFGEIINARVLRDTATGKPKGVGFVRFNTKKEAQTAIDVMNGSQPPHSAKPLNVKFANSVVNTAQVPTGLVTLPLSQTPNIITPQIVDPFLMQQLLNVSNYINDRNILGLSDAGPIRGTKKSNHRNNPLGGAPATQQTPGTQNLIWPNQPILLNQQVPLLQYVQPTQLSQVQHLAPVYGQQQAAAANLYANAAAGLGYPNLNALSQQIPAAAVAATLPNVSLFPTPTNELQLNSNYSLYGGKLAFNTTK
uniref:ELAV-like protein 2 n=1 Tax=Strongyloides venezuelensis TaxID=75913 RepID=A0A0K0EXF9_STRVS